MKLLINQDVNVRKWSLLFSHNIYSSPFQSHEFYELFNAVKGFRADVFAIEESEKIIALVVVAIQKEKGLIGYFSRRGIIYGGPLLTSISSATFLLNSVNRYYRGRLIYIESRNLKNYDFYDSVFKKNKWNYVPWLNFQLNIENEEQLKKNMSSSRWRQIKKARKEGTIWEEAKSLEEVKEYFNILSELYRSKIKKPLLPWEFFRYTYERNAGKFLLVCFDKKVIGGIMCPILKDQIIYEMYVCGLDQKYKKQYPSVFATWAAIEYGLQNNIKLFDFMGAGSPEDQYGVREFKARFGGEQVEYGRYNRVLNPFLYNIGKLGLKLFQKIYR